MNLKQAFYKDYYNGIDPCSFSKNDLRFGAVEEYNKKIFLGRNKDLLGKQFSKEELRKLFPPEDKFGAPFKKFTLSTLYPGIFSGSGYSHETGNIGEFKLGFFFDHTTGLPILPGHTVKGVLRSLFPRWDVLVTKEPEEVKRVKSTFISDLLLELGVNVPDHDTVEWIKKLELAIFEGKDPSNLKHTIPMGSRDVFLDAVIVKPGKNKKLLGSDTITPHGDNPLKNPIPLPFLKVLPGVIWQFSFLLHSTNIDNIVIDASIKRELFKSILLHSGIGAKTNVGYGHFHDPELPQKKVVQEKKEIISSRNDQSGTKESKKKNVSEPKARPLSRWQEGDTNLFGTVNHLKGTEVFFSTNQIEGFDGLLLASVPKTLIKRFSPGKLFQLKLKNKKKNSAGNISVQVFNYNEIN